jgi:hypothetical protein
MRESYRMVSRDEADRVDAIDDHLKLFGKRAYEIAYGDECQFCHSRIDEIGWCGCDTIGGG